MNGVISSRPDADRLVDDLLAAGFPAAELNKFPISALEGMATEQNGVLRPVCRVGCLACCADALPLSAVSGPVSLLTPDLLSRFLLLLEEFAGRGYHLLSRGRLNLFSGNNELDHPYCVENREILSEFLLRNYSIQLGYTSSDIAFHVSGTERFLNNLRRMIEKPLLWDNICFAIDEQIPFRNRAEYERHLNCLSEVWKRLLPALLCELSHSKPQRTEGPRVIINMLVPGPGASFAPGYEMLFPGGPRRAETFEELVRRYVKPFVGNLEILSSKTPCGHIFTTALGSLSAMQNSRVYVSAVNYCMTGRAARFIRSENPAIPFVPVVRTKAMTIGRNLFRIKACHASSECSEDELNLPSHRHPLWFDKLDSVTLDVSGICKDAPEIIPPVE